MNVGLIDVDGHNFPNLALMKISAWHKGNGDHVEWWDGFETGTNFWIDKGSFWNLMDTNFRIAGGEVRLESPDTLDWLEISGEDLTKYFELVESENDG